MYRRAAVLLLVTFSGALLGLGPQILGPVWAAAERSAASSAQQPSDLGSAAQPAGGTVRFTAADVRAWILSRTAAADPTQITPPNTSRTRRVSSAQGLSAPPLRGQTPANTSQDAWGRRPADQGGQVRPGLTGNAGQGPSNPQAGVAWTPPVPWLIPRTTLSGLRVRVTLDYRAQGGPLTGLDTIAAQEPAPAAVKPTRTAATLPQLTRRSALVFEAQSLAHLAIGPLSVPDGAIQTAWTLLSDLRWPRGMGMGSRNPGPVGRSGAEPTRRRASWAERRRLSTLRNAGLVEPAGRGSTRLLGGATAISEMPVQDMDWIQAVPEPAPVVRLSGAGLRRPLLIHMAWDGVSLPPEACRILDLVARRLRGGAPPLVLESTDAAKRKAPSPVAMPVRAQALTIRAYLGKRGVSDEQVRIKPLAPNQGQTSVLL